MLKAQIIFNNHAMMTNRSQQTTDFVFAHMLIQAHTGAISVTHKLHNSSHQVNWTSWRCKENQQQKKRRDEEKIFFIV